MMEPTPQQQAVIDADEGDLLVEACPGSGKTATLVERCHALPPGETKLVLAFNKRAAEEFSRRMGCVPGADVRTFHSFCFRELMSDPRIYGYRSKPRVENQSLLRLMLEANRDSFMYRRPRTWAEAGWDEEFARELEHSWYDGDITGPAGDGLDPIEKATAQAVLRFRRWQVEQGVVTFDAMVRLVAENTQHLSPPAQHVMVDEYQDVDRFQYEIALALSRLPGVKSFVVVGDPNQCQPGSTLVTLTGGSTKALRDVRVGDEVVSFDRGSGSMVGMARRGQRVTRVSARPYVGDLIRVRAGGSETSCTVDHLWTVRPVRAADIWVTYLMQKGSWFRVGYCQLYSACGDYWTLHVATRARLEGADRCWVLGVHRVQSDAVVEEAVIAARFGLPTVTFKPVSEGRHLTRANLGRVFAAVGSRRDEAVEVLREFGRVERFPFWEAGSGRPRRTTLLDVRACNLLPGIMEVPVFTGRKQPKWCGFGIQRERVEMPVYSIEVAKTRTYVADGIVTHNCIYEWRGALADAFGSLRGVLNGSSRTLPMTVNFRSHDEILVHAEAICPVGMTGVRGSREGAVSYVKRGADGEADRTEAARQLLDGLSRQELTDVAILCRYNRDCLKWQLDLARAGIPVYMLGAGDFWSQRHVQMAVKAREYGATIDRLIGTEDWQRFASSRRFRDNPEKLQEAIEDAKWVLSLSATELGQLRENVQHEGGIRISSIHRSKGLEWARVMVHGVNQKLRDEKYVWYVAATRARDQLILA
ncbi:AAA family ATPase [Candidatus Binatia bacterium]|nr:AAA family ATPase [Candidatus Binatia bacterium]